MNNGYILRIELDRIKPPIWRRFEIPPDLTLGDLHQIIQQVMGWYNCHLHSFEIGGARYENAQMDELDDCLDEDSVTVSKVLGSSVKKFKYIYDFGDYWVHTVKVEGESPSKVSKMKILKGRRACPPEDCGGPWGYAELLKTISDPKRQDYEEMLEWLGGSFNPEHFKINETK